MNKAVKIAMIGISIVASVIAVALIVFFATFDLNNYKERIANAVREETGRSLHFGGDIDLTIFPWLGVELGPLQLSNREGFGQAPMVQVVSATVEVKLLPLLRGDIEFGHLKLDQPSLRLTRHKDGSTNWDDLVGRQDNDDIQNAAGDDNDFSLAIEGISIKGATLRWDDQMHDTQFMLSGIKLDTGRIYQGAPFPVDARLDYECSTPMVKGSITLNGKSSIDFASRVYSHMDTAVTISAEGEDIPGGKAEASIGWKLLVLDFAKEHAQITAMTAIAYGATTHLDGSFEGLTDGLKKAAATLKVDPFDMRKTLKTMGMEAPNTGSPDALTSVALDADFSFVPGNIRVKSFAANVDGASFKATGRIKRGNDGPFYFARIDIDTLNLDKYLPPEHKENAEETKKAIKAGEKDDVILRSEILRRLHIDSEAKIGTLVVEGAQFSNVKAEVKARQGLVRVSPVSADAYGGTISAGITINAVHKYPKTDLIMGIDKLDVGNLTKDMKTEEAYGGIAHLNAALSCEGDQKATMLRSLNGKISFNLKDGVFPGVDLMRMVKKTHEVKNDNNGTVEASETDTTSFGSIAGTAVITNGVLRNRDLEVKAPGYRADGEGAIELPSRKIDYLVKVKLTPLAGGQEGKSSKDLYGVMVPIRVTGTMDDPHYWVSVSEYVKALGGAVIGTAGAVLGGVKKVITGVGSAITGDNGQPDQGQTGKDQPQKRKRFLGIF